MNGRVSTTLFLGMLALAGCGGDNLGPSASEYEPNGFSAYGAGSDAAPPPAISSNGDANYRIASHMDKQDPRWADREWRDEQRARRLEEANRDRRRKQRVEEHRRRRAATLEEHGGY